MRQSSKRLTPRFSIRWMLLLLAPLAMAFAYWGQIHRQRVLAIRAYQHMLGKQQVLLHYQVGTDHIVNFQMADVTDDDLVKFLPAFNPHAENTGIGKIIGLRLNGSDVTDEALERFREAVPGCTVEP